jgi:hypothetical protein
MTSPAPSTGSWLPWVQRSVQAMPMTTNPAFIGHQFRHDGTRYTIHRKTASKRGGTSWIWRWGTEIRKEGVVTSQKVGWLCCICWDKKVIHPVGTSSTTPAVTHLREKHRLNSDGAIEDWEGLRTCSTSGATTVSICLRFNRWHTTFWPSRQ